MSSLAVKKRGDFSKNVITAEVFNGFWWNLNHTYTVFKSKWQIVNLCSSKTTSLKAFKFSVNVGNNWPFCHVQTWILILNSLGSVKQTKYAQFSGLNFFSWFIWKDLSLSMYRCQKNWARTPGLVSNDRKFFRDYTFT